MITIDKLAGSKYIEVLPAALLNTFNNAFDKDLSIILIGISHNYSVGQVTDMLHKCTDVIIHNMVHTDHVSLYLELRGHSGYPGGEHEDVLGTFVLIITEIALNLILTNYIYNKCLNYRPSTMGYVQ